MAKQVKSKNQLRREKLKQKKQQDSHPSAINGVNKDHADIGFRAKAVVQQEQDAALKSENTTDNGKIFESEMDKLLEQPEFAQFKKVFDKFHMDEHPENEANTNGDIMESDDDEVFSNSENEESQEKQRQISKKKQKKINRIPLSSLKSRAKYPELVQWYDVDAQDPMLVVQIKCHKNYVSVPRHWSSKRDYLSGKRGFEKKPFELPKYIQDTGITDMRDTTKEDETSLKQQARSRVQPKLNRLDLDYQKLHDAFFKFQKKPRLFDIGDVYYEGKETEELDTTRFRPGIISEELRNALGLPQGVTLPWVAKMQHYGPPPSYGDMKIPGYNAPLENDGVTMFDSEELNIEGVDSEPFGKLLSYEEEGDDDEEEEEEDGEQEVDDEEMYREDNDNPVIVSQEDVRESVEPNYEANDEDEEEGVQQDTSEDEDDIPLAEVSLPKDKDAIEPKKLYEILKEKIKTDQAASVSSRMAYELPTNSNKRSSEDHAESVKRAKPDPQAEKKDNGDDDEDDEDDSSKFKF